MAWTLAGMRVPLGVGEGFASKPGDERRTPSLRYLCFQKHPALHQVSSLRRLSSRRTSSFDTESTASTMNTSDNVLVPGIQNDISTSTDVSPQVDNEDVRQVDTDDVLQVDTEDDPQVQTEKVQVIEENMEQSTENDAAWKTERRSIPPCSTGQRIYEIDPLLKAHRTHLDYRYSHYRRMRHLIDQNEGGLDAFSRGYEKFGFNRSAEGITYREWAPGAKGLFLIVSYQRHWECVCNLKLVNISVQRV